MTQDVKENPYVKLNRLSQDHSRRTETIATLQRDIDVLKEQLRKKELELQENVNAKVSVEAKMKETSKELT